MVRLILLAVAGLVFQMVGDILFTPQLRPELNVQAALLLAHILPTFWVPYKGFDKLKEKWEISVYANAGPAGFGVFLGSLIRGLVVSHEYPEGIAFSTILLAGLAMVVAFGYWSNRIMSRTFAYDIFEQSDQPESVKNLVRLLRLHQYGELADEAIVKIMAGNGHELLQDEWMGKVHGLIGNECYPGHLAGVTSALKGNRPTD